MTEQVSHYIEDYCIDAQKKRKMGSIVLPIIDHERGLMLGFWVKRRSLIYVPLLWEAVGERTKKGVMISGLAKKELGGKFGTLLPVLFARVYENNYRTFLGKVSDVFFDKDTGHILHIEVERYHFFFWRETRLIARSAILEVTKKGILVEGGERRITTEEKVVEEVLPLLGKKPTMIQKKLVEE
jgi:uncharacterized protein YrrD